MSHHSEDYKEVAVKHYLEGKDDMRDTCKLFKCKYQSLLSANKSYIIAITSQLIIIIW